MRSTVGALIVRFGLRVRGRRAVTPGTSLLTRDESWQLLEERSCRLLGMSAAEFERRLSAGELPDTSTVRSLSFLIGEIPAR